MFIFPQEPWLPPLPTIHSLSFESIGFVQQATLPASAVWPTANRAIYLPFHIDVSCIATAMFCLNGSAVSGNLDLGIYSADKERLVSSGSTAQSGTTAPQVVDITDTTLAPGDYYMAMAMDNGTGAVFRTAANTLAEESGGFFQQATAFALPASATFSKITSAYVPMIGILISPRTGF